MCVCVSHVLTHVSYVYQIALCAGHCAKGWVDSGDHGVWGREWWEQWDPSLNREVTEEMAILSRQ